MPHLKSNNYLKIFLSIFIGMGLLFIPLVGDFHIESALLMSFAGCFWAGIRGCYGELKKDFFDALQITGYLFLVGLPLFIYALFSGCFSIDGLAFWLLFPLSSVFFGYAIGRLLRSWNVSYRRWITIAILLIIAIGILLYEFLTFPQVYFFNHVWGGWPGPIYDEVVKVNSATVFFRSLTLLWTILLWHTPTIHREQYAKWIVGFAAIAIAFSYTQLAEFGVISPRSHLQNALGGHKSTENFELYFDHELYSNHEIELLAKEHEFYFEQISDQLKLAERDTTDKIESYLYGHPWQKKKLVGAKFTSFVPVWLEQDQLHIAKQQAEGSLQHELVHVLAKEFGNELFNASWSIGLIEGLAVAITHGSSTTSTLDQIVVSEKPYYTAKELRQSFSPLGFYGGRSGVNYITSGSFVKFLMQNYPIESLKEAYREGDIAGGYSQDLQILTENWHQHLDTVEVDSVDQQIASQIFGMQSLFEQKCPHVISDFATVWDEYQLYQAKKDTARALQSLNKAVTEADSLSSIKAKWAFQNLENGNLEKVQQAATLQDTTVDLQLLYADAFAMIGEWDRADSHLKEGQQLFSEDPDSLLKPALDTRIDRRQWEIYRDMTYHNQLPDSTTFAEANYRTKIRSLQKAMELERWEAIKSYIYQLLENPLHPKYFDDYQQFIHQLAFMEERDLAKYLIDEVSSLSLRNRYRERLQQEREWMEFVES